MLAVLVFQSLSRDSVCLDLTTHWWGHGAGLFQSLSRDSVCLDLHKHVYTYQFVQFQSLSRDSVCLDWGIELPSWFDADVSIPESGFCLFGRNAFVVAFLLLGCFNP